MSTVALFDTLAPALSEVAEETKTAALVLASKLLDPEMWQDLYAEGVVYRAAHIVASSDEDFASVAGGITSVRTADLSINSSGPVVAGQPLSTTSYGQTFLSLQNAVVVHPTARKYLGRV